MTGDEILDAMEHIDPDLIEAADTPTQKRPRKPYWIATVAAVLALAIGLGAILGGNGIPGATTGPVQIDSRPTIQITKPTSPDSRPTFPSQVHTKPPEPNPSLPYNFYFDSIAQLQGLLDAANESQEALDCYIEVTHMDRWGSGYPLQSDIWLLAELLDSTPLPCRNDHNITLSAIYYHPARFYEEDTLEVFYDINGIRYCFLASDKAAWTADGEDVTIVSIGNISAELREGSYGSSRRLIATFYVGDQVISMWAYTTDPSEVDLSGFSWGNLLDLHKP